MLHLELPLLGGPALLIVFILHPASIGFGASQIALHCVCSVLKGQL